MYVHNFHFAVEHSTYLSGAFLLKGSCFKTSLPCFCLHVSLVLAMFVPHMGHVSDTVITITFTVAAWMAVCVTIDWIASDSAISAQFHETSTPDIR